MSCYQLLQGIGEAIDTTLLGKSPQKFVEKANNVPNSLDRVDFAPPQETEEKNILFSVSYAKKSVILIYCVNLLDCRFKRMWRNWQTRQI
ncbi:hypothetical protein NIES2119_24635 [[Phormidium ambiguum] IAM M-71]|uniref:Uncharacterized protein n=1 Tax=[Phormidium ambiguum] IAM M-71 TaxID=454136 RepID=A0A1U7I917_9CYAN|nr:hypothetical protein [Phormidium ambiguum]OKH32929.1 hypothetical protein NIES2119_24635 [Phormidium ambiguum IAM M-71]